MPKRGEDAVPRRQQLWRNAARSAVRGSLLLEEREEVVMELLADGNRKSSLHLAGLQSTLLRQRMGECNASLAYL